ncbi:MAG: biotin/lipoyl-binding protein [Bacteroidales bacterium]|nr:biotin/lipoyl-binding protein [Bacteroidales bacterium]
MKQFKFKINGNVYEVEVQNIEDNIATVEVNGSIYNVAIDQEMVPRKTPKIVQAKSVPTTDVTPATAKTSNPNAPKGGGTIKSPLPGEILEIYVKVGDVVKLGQKLLMLEAMKMENNIDSDKEGKISEIKVNRGSSVMEGDVLIVIE